MRLCALINAAADRLGYIRIGFTIPLLIDENSRGQSMFVVSEVEVMFSARPDDSALDGILDIRIFGEIPGLVEFYLGKRWRHDRNQEMALDPKVRVAFRN